MIIKIPQFIDSNEPIEKLKYESLILINESFHSYNRLILSGLSRRFVLGEKTCTQLKEILINYFEDNSPKQLGYRKSMDYEFYSNEIPFKSLYTDVPYEQLSDFNKADEHMSFNCINEYFNDRHIKNVFNKLKPEKFIGIIDKEENNLYVQSENIRCNYDIWTDYQDKLIRYFFADFMKNEKYSSKNLLRYTKELNDEFILAIEFQKQTSKPEIKLTELNRPLLFISLIEKAKRIIRNRNYSEHPTDGYLSFGIFANPAFFNYANSAGTLAFIILEIKHDGKIKIGNSDFEIFKTDLIVENIVRDINIGSLNEVISLNEFYFMSTLMYTTKPYLSYIESIANDLVNRFSK
jgi:hypothetical protein